MNKKQTLNIILLGIPVVWRLVKKFFGKKIDTDVKDVIDGAVDSLDNKS